MHNRLTARKPIALLAVAIVACLITVYLATSNAAADSGLPYGPYNLGNIEPIQIDDDDNITDEGVKGTTGKTPAVKGEEPWLAALIYKAAKDNDNGYFCAGTLIAPQFVLTAAHCLEGLRPQQIEINVGKFDLTSAEGEVIQAKKLYLHKDFEPSVIINGDVAVIELERPATTGAFLPPITAASAQFAEPGDMARTVGWGLLRWLDNHTTDIPHGINYPITTERQCRAGYEGDNQINADNICAGLLTGQASSCNGDSGSALIVKSDDGSQAYQAGIVSAGATCGAISKYTIFTRVSFYNDWVARVVAGTYSTADTEVVTSVIELPQNFFGFNLTTLPFGFSLIDASGDDFELFAAYANDAGQSLFLTAINGNFANLDEVAGAPLEEVVPAEDITTVDGVQVVISDFGDFVEAVYVRNGILVFMDADITIDEMRTIVSTVMANSN